MFIDEQYFTISEEYLQSLDWYFNAVIKADFLVNEFPKETPPNHCELITHFIATDQFNYLDHCFSHWSKEER